MDIGVDDIPVLVDTSHSVPPVRGINFPPNRKPITRHRGAATSNYSPGHMYVSM